MTKFTIIFYFLFSFIAKTMLSRLQAKYSKNLEDFLIDKVEIHRHIVNHNEFQYSLNPGKEFCSNKSKLFLIIYVHTTPGNLKRRVAIRETWGNPSLIPYIKTVFIMGIVKDLNVMNSIRLEYGVYKDIVQENFIDSYRNLTYKGIAALKWISTYCSKTNFLLKVDDDMIVDTFALIDHLKSLNNHNAIKPRTVLCNFMNKAMVFRDKKSKWYISRQEHRQNRFGKYCSGAAFVLTSDMAAELYRMSFYVRFFWIDDYYITGLLVRAIRANYEKMNSLYTFERNVEKVFMKNNGQIPVFAHLSPNINIFYKLWRIILFKHLTNSFDEHLAQPPSLFDNIQFIDNFEWDSKILR